jgi:hypothetical protein
MLILLFYLNHNTLLKGIILPLIFLQPTFYSHFSRVSRQINWEQFTYLPNFLSIYFQLTLYFFFSLIFILYIYHGTLYSKYIKNILDVIPDERLLTETDNPGGTKWMIDHIGYPDQIRQIVQGIGKQKNMTEKEVESLVEKNFIPLISDVPQALKKWKALKSE